MSKTDSIDFSSERLMSMVSDYLDDHDYIRALKILNKNAELNGNDGESYMQYAFTFDDMGMYVKCINAWFKHIDYEGDKAEFFDAYDGISVNLMNLGLDNFAIPYYEKVLALSKEMMTREDKAELLNLYAGLSELPSLRIAYSAKHSKKLENTEKLYNGMSHMRAEDYEGAIAEFNKVPQDGKQEYFAARNHIASCYILQNMPDEAEKVCLDILEREPDNVEAMASMVCIRQQQDRMDEALEIAKHMTEIDTADDDVKYRVATVCCECGLDADAYRILSSLGGQYRYDDVALFFRAAAAYNCRNLDKCLEVFDILLTIYPECSTADYWYHHALKRKQESRGRWDKIPYTFRLPEEKRKINIFLLTAANRLTGKELAKFREKCDLHDEINWSLDPTENIGSLQLQIIGSTAAIKMNYVDAVRDLLLDINFSEGIKMSMLGLIATINDGGVYGVTVCYHYMRIVLPKINIGSIRRNFFLKAYGHAISKVALLSEAHAPKLAESTEALYAKLEREGRLNCCKSFEELGAAIAKYAALMDGNEEYTAERVGGLFFVKEKTIERIIGDPNETIKTKAE